MAHDRPPLVDAPGAADQILALLDEMEQTMNDIRRAALRLQEDTGGD